MAERPLSPPMLPKGPGSTFQGPVRSQRGFQTAVGYWFPEFEVATVPDASDHEGEVIFVSDGASGDETLARSDGTDWIALDGSGVAISTGV